MLRIPGVKLSAAVVGNTPFNLCMYGHLTAGKTHMAADAAKHYMEQGKKVVYVVTPGEDPHTTLVRFGLGEIIATVNSLTDYEKVMKALKGNIDVVILDSIKGLQRMVFDQKIGKDKYPKVTKTENDWPQCHDAFISAMNLWKDAAEISIALCPADRSSDRFDSPDAQKPNLICCDLAGKMAADIRSIMSYMGYIESDLDEDNSVFNRTISFVPSRRILTLARGLLRQMTQPIPLVDGVGNWERVLNAFEEHKQEEVQDGEVEA
jgi:hypothetical protein